MASFAPGPPSPIWGLTAWGGAVSISVVRSIATAVAMRCGSSAVAIPSSVQQRPHAQAVILKPFVHHESSAVPQRLPRYLARRG